MVSFPLGRVADRILQPSEDRQLAKKLRQIVEVWAKKNQPPVHAGALDTIFSPDVDESDLERFAARRRLSETILSKSVPSAHDIRNALLERWDEIQSGSNAQDLEDFFRLPRDEAAKQLDGLAGPIRMVLQEDQRLFQVTVLELLEELTKKISTDVAVPTLEDTDRDGLVVILPGIAGDGFAGVPSARNLGRAVGENSRTLSQLLDYQIWDWYTIEAGPSVLGEGAPNLRRARACYALLEGRPMLGIWQGSRTQAISRMMNGGLSLRT